MKKILLFVFFLSIMALPKLNAQVLNASFENWSSSTAYFSGLNFFPPDTFPFSDPVDWTTTNALSGADTFGNLFLVTQTNDAHTGVSALALTTKAFDTVGTPLGPRQLTIPGLALNGVFPLNIPSNVLLLGGTISPAVVPGAGQPFSQRLAAIKGFFKYTPVFNTFTNSLDSFMVWATLRRGTEIVANAIFKANDTVSTYTAFSAPFEYVSCATPDTLVILIASSVPNFGSLLTGTTPLTPGSVLKIDDLDYDTLAASFNFPPIANKDYDTTYINTPKLVDVLANDADCDGQVLTVTVGTNSLHGTWIAVGSQISYTPNIGFTGYDSIQYQAVDANGSATAWARITVLNNSGISEANEISVAVYPVPAANELNIQFENSGKTIAKVYDMIGNLVLTSVFTQNNNHLNIATLPNGFYGIQLTNDKNAVIARSKFTVSK